MKCKTNLTKLLYVCLLSVANPVSAQDESGFASGTDLMLGYSEKVFSTSLGYDLGYKWRSLVYLGVGPVAGFSTGNGQSNFSGGGYGKLRITIPIKTEIKPFVEGRTGYSYNFKNENGAMFYGAGAGVKFNKMVIGVYVGISSTTTETKETYSYFQPSSQRIRIGKTSSGPTGTWHTGTRVNEETEWHFTPNFLIGFEF